MIQGCVFRRTINRNVLLQQWLLLLIQLLPMPVQPPPLTVSRDGPSQPKVYVACGENDDDAEGSLAYDSQVCGFGFRAWVLVFRVSRFAVWRKPMRFVRALVSW